MSTPSNNNNQIYLRGGWIAMLLALVVWITSFVVFYLPGKRNFSEIGPLGDWVTGLTAPFLSMAGFFLIYAAFRQQSSATEAARHEFLLQRFETVFFHLIQLYHQNVQTIQDSYGKKAQEDFFEAAHRFLKKRANNKPHFEALSIAYQEYYAQNYNHIDHFIRHLLFCINFVHLSNTFDGFDSQEARREREHYLHILQAQLSTEEMILLFYHTLCDPTGYTGQYRSLLTDYQFFGRLTLSSLLAPGHWAAYCELPEPQAASPESRLRWPPETDLAHAHARPPIPETD